MRRSLAFIVLLPTTALLLTTVQLGASGAAEPVALPASAERLGAHVRHLASDALEGRLVGTPGIALAEEYIRDEFAAAGLEPGAGDSWYEPFDLTRFGFDPDATSLRVDEAIYRPGADLRALSFSGSGRVRRRLVFAGFGIRAPSVGRDDYEGLDVRDAVVVVLRGEPEGSDAAPLFAAPTFTEHAWFATKAERAYDAGAAALVVVNVPGRRGTPAEFVPSAAYALSEEPPSLPEGLTTDTPADFLAVHVASDFLDLLADSLAMTPDAIVAAAERREALPGGGLTADLRVTHLPARDVVARNVVGLLPATTAESGGTVLVTAHHDHLGALDQPGDSIFNGADDNASGVASVLELARLLAMRERSHDLLFVTFSAEEHGLLGAQAFASGSIPAGRTIAAVVNLDMVSRNPGQPIDVYHNGRGPLSGLPYERLAAELGLTVRVRTGSPPPSDHLVFHRMGHPALSFFTGLHDDYHGVDDEADRTDPAHHAAVTSLAYRIVLEMIVPR